MIKVYEKPNHNERLFFFFDPESILNQKQSKHKQLLFCLLIGTYTWEVRGCLMNRQNRDFYINGKV